MDFSSSALSPLADPVIGAIFANAEVAGLASESIIRAILKSENEPMIVGKIISVTPQRTHSSPALRGCRVDIDTQTDDNEFIRYEVQIAPEMHIMVRDLFSAAHLLTEKSSKGDTSAQMAAKMPRVIYINLLGYVLRGLNTDAVQPFKIMYTKPPQEIAIPNFGGYNIQLPRILEMPANFDDALYCWCYTLYTAHLEKKTVREVVTMTPELQAFAEKDAGFRQFYERYETVSANPETRREYVAWFNEALRLEGMLDWARQEGRDEVESKLADAEQKLEKSERKQKEAMLSAARIMKSRGVPRDIISEAFPALGNEIEAL
ncbi:MAG: Rpn family recombination-promoting nuclease/putative transposase [Defluviitaleaceae bacterium]|nr:Rpn family recombination-promoting nuclease/putative transposase [Defluviitaleaceae bacterium]